MREIVSFVLLKLNLRAAKNLRTFLLLLFENIKNNKKIIIFFLLKREFDAMLNPLRKLVNVIYL